MPQNTKRRVYTTPKTTFYTFCENIGILAESNGIRIFDEEIAPEDALAPQQRHFMDDEETLQ